MTDRATLGLRLLELTEQLEPGMSVSVGRAWDGSTYVRHEQTTPGQWLGGVRRTIAYGSDLAEALDARQEESR